MICLAAVSVPPGDVFAAAVFLFWLACQWRGDV